ncbi:MAG: DnaD domain protein [Clostridiaceae bacterium]|nr:DnaD domain protein [Clostridiaceae bacterium]
MYSLNSSLYASVFVVPRDIVDKYIKMASFCAVKSLLWILNYRGGAFSVSELAKSIGSSEADVKEALDYWVNEGVLVKDGETVAAQPVTSDSHLLKDKAEKAEKPAEKKEVEIKEELVLPTYEQVVTRMNEDKKIEELINHVQFMLGRTTGQDMNARLVQMVDGYGLPIEIILRLIQYCVDIGKTSNAFILGVAKSWYKNEISTLEQADEYINSHSRAQSIYNDFRMLTGLTAPQATSKQEEYFIKWDSYKTSVEMMVYAYEITVEKTGKISFAYMDKIISSWHENGYKTPEDVDNAAKAKAKPKNDGGASYDINKTMADDENKKIVFKKKTNKRGDS